jgi:hypothetical protein
MRDKYEKSRKKSSSSCVSAALANVRETNLKPSLLIMVAVFGQSEVPECSKFNGTHETETWQKAKEMWIPVPPGKIGQPEVRPMHTHVMPCTWEPPTTTNLAHLT